MTLSLTARPAATTATIIAYPDGESTDTPGDDFAPRPEIQLNVTRKTVVAINAKIDLPEGGYIKAKSMSSGIKLTINAHANPRYHRDDVVTVSERAFDALGRVFDAVRDAREEAAQ